MLLHAHAAVRRRGHRRQRTHVQGEGRPDRRSGHQGWPDQRRDVSRRRAARRLCRQHPAESAGHQGGALDHGRQGSSQ